MHSTCTTVERTVQQQSEASAAELLPENYLELGSLARALACLAAEAFRRAQSSLFFRDCDS